MNEPRIDKSSGDEDESEDSSSSSEEEDDSEVDSGMEGDEGDEHGDGSEVDTEDESEVAKDFCTHKQVCRSIEECIIYRTRIKQENRRLKKKLDRLRSEQKTGEEMEKKRALSIIKQTINVESKIARLEQMLTWVDRAREKRSPGQAAKGGQVQKDSQQKQRPSVVAGSSNDMECQEERLDH